MSDSCAGKMCSSCKTAFTETSNIKVCPTCGEPYHQECWDKNMGCVNLECADFFTEETRHDGPDERQPEIKNNKTTGSSVNQVQCKKCGSIFEEWQKFCTQCGNPKEKTQFCPDCGIELPPGTDCPKCSVKTTPNIEPQKKEKKKLSVKKLIIIIGLAIGVFIIGSCVNGANKAGAYQSNAADFADKVSANSLLLEHTGNEMSTNWYGYIYEDTFTSVDASLDAARLTHAEDIKTVKASRDEITELYTKLLDSPSNTDNYNDKKVAVKETYDAYINLYDSVLSFNGTYTTFSSNFTASDAAVSKAYDKYIALFNN